VTEVLQRYGSCPDLTHGVDQILTGSVRGLSVNRFEEGRVVAFHVQVRAGSETDRTGQGTPHIRENIAE
jgi:hypothetical protein